MGIYDRDYERSGYGDQPGFHLGAPQSITVKIIIFTVIVFAIQLVSQGQGANPFTSFFSLHDDWYLKPWKAFQLLTYGFLHSPQNMWHILGNMFMLGMFGTHLEERYRWKEFLAFYLTAIVFSGLFWSLAEIGSPQPAAVLGASGGVSAVLLLFIFNYPRVTLRFMMVFPMPAWVLGVIIIAQDMLGVVKQQGGIAFTAHLGGFLFAFLYYKSGLRLMDYIPTSFKLPSFKRKPPLRVHRPSAEQESREDKSEQRLNQLLDKVHASGQESLTTAERNELQKLSKHYQNKRR